MDNEQIAELMRAWEGLPEASRAGILRKMGVNTSGTAPGSLTRNIVNQMQKAGKLDRFVRQVTVRAQSAT